MHRSLRTLFLLLLLGRCSAHLEFHVDCGAGLDSASGSTPAPFRTVHRAQQAIRAARARSPRLASPSPATVFIRGLCQLPTPLVLSGELDSHTRYVGAQGSILSAGTQLQLPPASSNSTEPVQVDLKLYNFSAANLGKLSGRGYAGGSACILVDNFEVSAAELFYRPSGARSAAGVRAYGPAQEGMMWIARSPNRALGGLPAVTDWAGISTVDNLTLTIDSFKAELPSWKTELDAGGVAYLHGLWAWNWADSHRPLLGLSGDNITVGADDINRDVNPIHVHKEAQQGGYVYAYGLKAHLDGPGEYHIDTTTAMLSFFPPEDSSSGSYSVSRLESVVVVRGVSNVSFEQLEIRYSRGAGVKIDDSYNVLLKGCTISDHGMMGVNITGGGSCGMVDSEVAANGDAGVVLMGGDRITLSPSRHFINKCTVHHNHRWIMSFSPDVMLAGTPHTEPCCTAHLADTNTQAPLNCSLIRLTQITQCDRAPQVSVSQSWTLKFTDHLISQSSIRVTTRMWGTPRI